MFKRLSERSIALLSQRQLATPIRLTFRGKLFATQSSQQHQQRKTIEATGVNRNWWWLAGVVALFAVYKKDKIMAEERKRKENVKSDDDDDDYRYTTQDNQLRAVLKGKRREEIDLTLFQYQVCPFCCKVRAFLDYMNIPYKMVEVNPLTKSEVSFSKNYSKVPIMMVNGIQVNDSSLIITTINEILDEQDGTVRDQESREREKEWRKWVDHKFVHTIPPNIYRTHEEAVAAFEYIATINNFSTTQRILSKYGGSSIMYLVSKRLKKKYNIQDERMAIYECGQDWIEEVGDQPFHGGQEPNLADLAVYGVLSSVEGLATFMDLLDNTDIGGWYYRVKEAVGSCKGQKIN